MIVDELLKNPGAWLSMRKTTGIVISSRIRLARNIAGVAFPGWAGEEERVRLCARLRSILDCMSTMAVPVFLDMGGLHHLDKDVLRERHLISHELCERGRGSGVAVADEEHIAIMINEEDHLRLQAISPGMNLLDIWRRLDGVDSELSEHVDYAFSDRLGYMTACPSNVGTGLRASVMMHLAGLKFMKEVDAVINGLERLGLTVRGLLGEGTEAHGNMYQISNQQTLGDSEQAIIDRLIGVCEEVIRHEQNARTRLLEKRRSQVLDSMARACGVLLNARILSSAEGVDLLSVLRLGVEMDLVKGVKTGQINEIMLLTQPGHLQKVRGRALGAQERDELRAQITRHRLQGVNVID